MLADLIRSLKNSVDSPDVRESLSEITKPCFDYIDTKISSITFLFQIIAIMILIQSGMVVFLLVLEIQKKTS
jgi:hypothetical protein